MSHSISVKNISKCYKIYPSRNARLKEWLLPFAKCHEDKWVLKNVDFDVEQGEAIGIIGMNGAGKSTLLKIITGTVMPTTGTVNFNGTVSALLELGLGFHPDFTGRQNVYMSGQLLGYSEAEITECMRQIEDFAEIGAAIDAPVRTYSSGMQVRLAFSVATMKRPDILIVDEALSVGDAYFQHKSFGRIKEFQKNGTTLLLVSHDKAAIQAVCNRALLLDKGCIIKQGNPEEIMDYYNALLGGSDSCNTIEQIIEKNGRIKTISGNHHAKISSIKIIDAKGVDLSIIGVGDVCKLVIDVNIVKSIEDMTCGILIKDKLGQAVFGTNSLILNQREEDFKENDRLTYVYTIPFNFGVGNYAISVALHGGDNHYGLCYEWVDLGKTFEIVNKSKNDFIGVAYVDVKLDVFRR